MKRFWDKVDIRGDAECWKWTAGIGNSQGYGTFSYKNKSIQAHRMSMILSGYNVDGFMVLHKCDNPPCVNPNHLFLGNQIDNMKDMVDKGRSPNNQGSKNPSSKLTEWEVIKIKGMLKLGIKQTEIGKIFGVHKATIHHIKSGSHWKHIK